MSSSEKNMNTLTVNPISVGQAEQGSSMQEQERENLSAIQPPTVTAKQTPAVAENQEGLRSLNEGIAEEEPSGTLMRDMQERMDRLVAEIEEISRFVPPPAYQI